MDIRSGKGVYICRTEDWVYDGDWEEDQKHGKGTYTCPHVAEYTGDWKHGLKSGRGVLKMDGFIYSGEFLNGFRCGFGEQVYPDLSKYEGHWKDDCRHGYGVLTTKTDEALGLFEMYKGQWQSDKKHGRGKYMYSSGACYDGDWAEDTFHGSGCYTAEDDTFYDGEWHMGRIHGKGRYVYSDGSSYEGEWADEQRSGYGVYTNGKKRYEGQWRNGVRHGFGKQFNRDGSSHEGWYVEDKRHGEGVHTFADLKTWKGRWEEDVRVGKGEYGYPPAYWELQSFKKKVLEEESRALAEREWEDVRGEAVRAAAHKLRVREFARKNKKAKINAAAVNVTELVLDRAVKEILRRAEESLESSRVAAERVRVAEMTRSILLGQHTSGDAVPPGAITGAEECPDEQPSAFVYQSDEEDERVEAMRARRLAREQGQGRREGSGSGDESDESSSRGDSPADLTTEQYEASGDEAPVAPVPVDNMTSVVDDNENDDNHAGGDNNDKDVSDDGSGSDLIALQRYRGCESSLTSAGGGTKSADSEDEGGSGQEQLNLMVPNESLEYNEQERELAGPDTSEEGSVMSPSDFITQQYNASDVDTSVGGIGITGGVTTNDNIATDGPIVATGNDAQEVQLTEPKDFITQQYSDSTVTDQPKSDDRTSQTGDEFITPQYTMDNESTADKEITFVSGQYES